MKSVERGDFTYRVTARIAEVDNVPIEELPPLGAAIDIEALERVLRSSSGDTLVEFTYCGWTIQARTDGRISMSEPTSGQGPYIGRCNTCSDEKRGVDLDTAQDFFAVHADDGHEVEIVRDDGAVPEQPKSPDGTTDEAAGID